MFARLFSEYFYKKTDKEFLCAVSEGKLTEVTEKLKLPYIDVNCKDEDTHESAFSIACRKGHKDIVSVLIEAKAEVGNAAEIAYQNKNFNVVTMLIQKSLINPARLFDLAIKNEDVYLIEALLYLENKIPERNVTEAFNRKSFAILRFLFHNAIETKNTTLVKLMLLLATKQPELLKIEKRNVIRAFELKQVDMLRLLFSDAIARQDVALIQIMLEHGCGVVNRGLLKVLKQDMDCAVSHGNLQIVNLLNVFFLRQFTEYDIPWEGLAYDKDDKYTFEAPSAHPFAEGSSANIFGATLNERPVAVKFLKRSALAEYYQPQFVLDQEYQNDFLNEVRIMTQLQSPYTVEFLGVVFHDPVPGIVMKRYNGSLRDAIKNPQMTKDLHQLLTWALQVSEGVAYLHKQGWLHNDLRPANILLDEKNHAVISDFGTACEISSRQKGTHSCRFFPPEAVLEYGELSQTEQSDIYSLGLLFLEMITGKSPFANKYELQIFRLKQKGQHETIPESCPQVFKELMRDCWQDDPAKRPAAADIVKRLKVALDQLHSSNSPVSPRFFTTTSTMPRETNSNQNKMGIT